MKDTLETNLPEEAGKLEETKKPFCWPRQIPRGTPPLW